MTTIHRRDPARHMAPINSPAHLRLGEGSEMSDMVEIVANCIRISDGRLVRSYDLPSPIPLDARRATQPSDQELIDQAKTGLANEGIAGPPYTGIKFEVMRR